MRLCQGQEYGEMIGSGVAGMVLVEVMGHNGISVSDDGGGGRMSGSAGGGMGSVTMGEMGLVAVLGGRDLWQCWWGKNQWQCLACLWALPTC